MLDVTLFLNLGLVKTFDMGYTRKQIRIILLMADGHSSAQIAEKVNIKAGTVSNHRKRILKASEFKNWNHFMAHHGRTGQLDHWAWLEQLRQPQVSNGTEDDTY